VLGKIKETTLKLKKVNFTDKKKFIKLLASILRALFIFGISYIILMPLIVRLSSSFMSQQDLYDQTVKWIPRYFTFENFVDVWQAMDFFQVLMNTFIFCLLVSTLQLLSCTMVGYGLARFEFEGNGLIFALVIFTLIVPPQLISLPLYLNFRYFDIYGLFSEPINLIGTYWPFILPSIFSLGLRNGLFIYIMRQFFKGLPRDLEEAAYVDGAGLFKTFYRVMLPGALPALVIVFLFAFVWQYNDYYFITLFGGGETAFLTIAMEEVVLDVLYMWGYNHQHLDSGLASIIRNTASLMFMAPLLILYGFLQRYFIESVERTGLVG
jgi:multiple sugar transport system permease protein